MREEYPKKEKDVTIQVTTVFRKWWKVREKKNAEEVVEKEERI